MTPGNEKDLSKDFFVALAISTFDETLKSVVKFLVTCLVSEILKDKNMTRRGIRHRLTFGFRLRLTFGERLLLYIVYLT